MSATYRVDFERIGRNRAVAPLETAAQDLDDLVSRIVAYGRRHLGTRYPGAWLLEDGTGGFDSGGRDAGRFTWQVVAQGGAS